MSTNLTHPALSAQILDGSKTFHSEVDVTVTPVLKFDMDNVFDYSYTIDSNYHSVPRSAPCPPTPQRSQCTACHPACHETGLSIPPQVTTWDDTSKLLCTHTDAKADGIELATLQINVPFVRISLAKEWGRVTRAT